MARLRRMKIIGIEAYYHIISRTVGQEFYLGDIEKEKLLSLIKHYSSIFFIKVIGYCLLENHFHLLIKSEPVKNYKDEDIAERVKKFRKAKVHTEEQFLTIKEKLGDISEYVRAIKQMFSRWYNAKNKRTGYFWGDRFKSVLIEPGESLLNCCAYIDLNPIRANIVQKPEDYRWSSICHRINGANSDKLLSFDGIYDEKAMSKEKMLVHYRKFVYACGNVKVSESKGKIPDEIFNKEDKMNYTIPTSNVMLKRMRYFTYGLALGSKIFINEIYTQFGKNAICKKNRNIYKTGISSSVLSVRKLMFQ